MPATWRWTESGGVGIGKDSSLSRLRLSCVAPRVTVRKRFLMRSREYLTKCRSAFVVSGMKPTMLSGKQAANLRIAVFAVLAPAIVTHSVFGGQSLLC